MNEQQIFQHMSMLYMNSVMRGQDSAVAISNSEAVLHGIVEQTKKIATSSGGHIDERQIFQQISQLTIGDVMKGTTPASAINRAVDTVQQLIARSQKLAAAYPDAAGDSGSGANKNQ